MPAIVSTIEPEVLAAFRAGDEAVLERLYRERYRGLLDAAKRELGDPSRAARVVERAAAETWKARSELESPAAFEQFLVATLHTRIVREQSRVAAFHHHAGAPATVLPARAIAPSVDVSWEHVKGLLHPAPSAEALSAVQSESRHHTAEHLAALGRQRRPIWSIVFVVAAALAVSALVFLGPRIGRDDVGKALASPEALRVESKPGQRGRLGLSDGTQAVLGANSKLIIPSGFASRLRALKLEGTASFTVAPHPKLSFLVRTDRATITALGTVFDVSAFPGDRLLTVRVRQGEVELKTPKGTRHVQQGEAVSVELSGLIFLASAVELAETLGWVDGQLVINDRPLRDALPVLHRWFDLDIRLAEEQLSDRRVTMRVGLDSTLTAIRLLQENAHVALTYDRNRPVLYDAGAARRR